MSTVQIPVSAIPIELDLIGTHHPEAKVRYFTAIFPTTVDVGFVPTAGNEPSTLEKVNALVGVPITPEMRYLYIDPGNAHFTFDLVINYDVSPRPRPSKLALLIFIIILMLGLFNITLLVYNLPCPRRVERITWPSYYY